MILPPHYLYFVWVPLFSQLFVRLPNLLGSGSAVNAENLVRLKRLPSYHSYITHY